MCNEHILSPQQNDINQPEESQAMVRWRSCST